MDSKCNKTKALKHVVCLFKPTHQMKIRMIPTKMLQKLFLRFFKKFKNKEYVCEKPRNKPTLKHYGCSISSFRSRQRGG